MHIGHGYDVHRFSDDVNHKGVTLGGVHIPFEKSLIAHSDGDVVIHALCDALLGALALGDIGKHFPDTDPRFKDISSIVLLKHVGELLKQNNYEIVNLDSTVVLQQPKIGPYVKKMRENIALALGIRIDQVSVKATTSEELGFIGLGEGAAVHAIACINEMQLKLNL